MKIAINGKEIGDGARCFLVAEAGTTCNGDISVAGELIDAAADGGFDAIKFQTIWPEQISDKSAVYRYMTADGWAEENMYEMFKGLVFSREEWQSLSAHARARELTFFSSVDFLDGVDILESCGVPLHKLGSWDVTYEPLVRKVAETQKPVMVDLGPATFPDIVRFLEICRSYGFGKVIFMQDFHTDNPLEMNMRNISYLKGVFGVPVGFSSPGRNDDLDIAAVSLGADVIEKRITLDRSTAAHHHVLSLEPGEFRPWIERVRFVEAALGSEEIRPPESDRRDAEEYFRSICATRPIRKGEIFSPENLDGKRPGTGIPTRYLEIITGRKAVRDIEKDTLLNWSDIGLLDGPAT